MTPPSAPAPATIEAAGARRVDDQEGSPRSLLYLRVSTKEQAERNGDPEGYSIPAQREACVRKALTLGATVEEQFVERGESAKTSQRPELQRMLRYVKDNPGVKYVIVHKIDRLARNRADDIAITLQLQAAGIQLISCNESIDETPSGQLLHGIMASIAQFYSQNLANEVMKGIMQKVQNGGTATQAPLGYLNVHKIIEGREVRTVDVDTERTPFVQWAFETYAKGEHSLSELTEELADRGLLQKATAKRPPRPLPRSRVHAMLTNRYYLGYVTYQGIEYPGKHTPIISEPLFAKVQQVLDAKRHAGDRSYRRNHYLKGTVRCARCGSKLGFCVSVGNGGPYEYFFCWGQHERRRNCGLPHIPAEVLEAEVVRSWRHEEIKEPLLSRLKARLEADLDAHVAFAEAERKRLDRRIAEIRRDRVTWAENANAGIVPGDIAREKQKVLADRLGRAEIDLLALQIADEDLRAQLAETFRQVRDCYAAYKEAAPELRRQWNQMWWVRLDVDVDEDGAQIAGGNRTDLYEAVQHDAGIVEAEAIKRSRPRSNAKTTASSVDGGSSLVTLADRTGQSLNRSTSSSLRTLVGVTGLEPVTSAV